MPTRWLEIDGGAESMARRKTARRTAVRRSTVKAVASIAANNARQLIARPDAGRSAASVETVGAASSRSAVIGLPQPAGTARREAVESMVLQLVSPNTRVLVVGRDTWPLSRALSSAGCRVAVVETRKNAPAGSATFSDRVIVSDPETLDFAAALDGAQFDSIVAVELLEHVRNPVRMLATLRDHLNADGAVVAAVPNIMHGKIRLGFFTGRSPAEWLAPDAASPPAHWYDAAALQRTFDRARFVITRLERQVEAFDAGTAASDDLPVPPALVHGLLQDADATTRTFVVVAHRSPLTGRVLLDIRVRELAQTHERVLRQMKEIDERGTDLDARYRDLKRAVDGAISTLEHMRGDRELVADRERQQLSSIGTAHQRLMTERVALEAIGRDLKRFQYEQLIQRVRALVESTLPKGALLLVVSKGDDRLLAFDDRHAWHFLRNEQGVYAGHHPADSVAAIEALERWRADGAGYLVIPQPVFWWLDHYAAFRTHLDRHARCVIRDERTAAIYALGQGKRR